MSTRLTKIVLVCAALTALITAHSTALAATTVTPDRIETLSNQTISGIKITKADDTGITYTRFDGSGGEQTLSISQIRMISWGDAGDFRVALKHYNEGHWAETIKALDGLPASGPRDFWYGPYKRLLYGQSLFKLKKYAEALPQLDEIVRKYDRSLYVLEAIDCKAQCHLALKQNDKVAEAYAKLDPKDQFDKLGSDEPYGKLWQLRGAIGRANALIQTPTGAAKAAGIYSRLNKFTDSAAPFMAGLPDAIKGSRAEIATIHERSLVGEVEALFKRNGKIEEVQGRLNDIIEKIKDPAARASMYTMLGDVLAKTAETIRDDKEKKVKYKQAMLAYMRVYILYPGQKEERARSMVGAAAASLKVAGKDDKSRAIRLCQEVMAEFPGTPQATEARQILESIGVKPK